MCWRLWEFGLERGSAVKPKHRRTLLILLVIGMAGGAGYLYMRVRAGGSPASRVGRITPRHEVQIRGFQFVGHHEGRRVLAVKADEFTIEKLKLGHFRLNLLNVARLQNGIIDIYGKSKEIEKRVASHATAREAPSPPTGTQGPERVTFGHAFLEKSLPSFGVKRVSSITIQPVTVKLHDEKGPLTEISASSGTIRLKTRDLLFEGEVRVLSGPRVLEADSLSFMPRDARLECTGPYALTTSGNTRRGEGFESDIFLRPVGRPTNPLEPATGTSEGPP
jgi:hypothetical protein